MNTKDPFNWTSSSAAYESMRTVECYADEWLVRELVLALEAGQDHTWEPCKISDGREIMLPNAERISLWLSEKDLNGSPIHQLGRTGHWEYANLVAKTAMENHLLGEMEYLHKAYPPLETDGPQLAENDPAPIYPTIGQRPNGNLCTAMPDIQQWLDVSLVYETEIGKMLEVEISYNDLRMSQQ